MLTREIVRLAAIQQIKPRTAAYKLIAAVEGLKEHDLAILWDANNLSPKIDLEYYVKQATLQSNP